MFGEQLPTFRKIVLPSSSRAQQSKKNVYWLHIHEFHKTELRYHRNFQQPSRKRFAAHGLLTTALGPKWRVAKKSKNSVQTSWIQEQGHGGTTFIALAFQTIGLLPDGGTSVTLHVLQTHLQCCHTVDTSSHGVITSPNTAKQHELFFHVQAIATQKLQVIWGGKKEILTIQISYCSQKSNVVRNYFVLYRNNH